MQNRSGKKVPSKVVPLPPGDLPAFFTQSPVPMAIVDMDALKVIGANGRFKDAAGFPGERLLGQALESLLGEPLAPKPEESSCVMKLRGRHVMGSMVPQEIKGRQCLLVWTQDVKKPVQACDPLEGIRARLDREIAERKKAEALSREREREVRRVRRELDGLNAALKILSRQRDEDRAEVESSLLANVKTSILPFLERLKDSRMSEDQLQLLAEIEGRLRKITEPFVHEISSGHLGLSPNEIRVASLIKEGRSSKEISRLLNISIHTVISHRYCIRRKTGIKGRKINLCAYLQGLKG